MKLIAHRGFSSKAPENTIASFELAINSGFNFIEFDVQLSRDQKPIIFHDEKLERTTNGKGLLKNKCLDEIKRLDCGRWFGSEFKNIKIPTLEEILQKFKNIAHFQIELKDNNNLLPEIVLDYLQKNDWYKSNFKDPYQVPGFSITSFHIKQILRTKKIDNKVIVGWLLEVNKKINKELFEYCKIEDINMIIPQVNSISEEDISLIDEIKKSRITLCAWGARNLEEVKKMSILGIDAMTVDWPDKALKVI